MAPRRQHVTAARVMLWGRQAGAVAWDNGRNKGSFEYDPSFVKAGIEISPLTMPLGPAIYSFPGLNHQTYLGLPGLLSDSLPDRFGNALIDLWLQRQGRSVDDFNPVERLCYIGSRGMGALEFEPPLVGKSDTSIPIEIAEMVKLAGDILAHRSALVTNVTHDTADALATILKIGTSAGGARPKAVIAWNPRTGEVRSGQVRPPRDFEPWILKFDGVNDTALGDPRGFGRVEYAYYKMAIAAGIDMSECRLLTEGPRAHFMTRRFDRDINGDKIHMQSLCALCHFDFNAPGAYGYEQAFSAIQRLNIGHEAIEELYRRMVFNVIARNHDDHTRNLAFLMDRSGAWKLAPAFDMIWSYNPRGAWTNRHQMRINGKLDEFTREDLQAPAGACRIRNAADIIAKVKQAVARWPDFAAEAGVEPAMSRSIGGTHRMNMP